MPPLEVPPPLAELLRPPLPEAPPLLTELPPLAEPLLPPLASAPLPPDPTAPPLAPPLPEVAAPPEPLLAPPPEPFAQDIAARAARPRTPVAASAGRRTAGTRRGPDRGLGDMVETSGSGANDEVSGGSCQANSDGGGRDPKKQ